MITSIRAMNLAWDYFDLKAGLIGFKSVHMTVSVLKDELKAQLRRCGIKPTNKLFKALYVIYLTGNRQAMLEFVQGLML
jgi:hypothetical protein